MTRRKPCDHNVTAIILGTMLVIFSLIGIFWWVAVSDYNHDFFNKERVACDIGDAKSADTLREFRDELRNADSGIEWIGYDDSGLEPYISWANNVVGTNSPGEQARELYMLKDALEEDWSYPYNFTGYVGNVMFIILLIASFITCVALFEEGGVWVDE